MNSLPLSYKMYAIYKYVGDGYVNLLLYQGKIILFASYIRDFLTYFPLKYR